MFKEGKMKIPVELLLSESGDTPEDRKRIHIFEAALKVFGTKGIARAKIADIAKEAGIGKGTIYEYFKSKEELFAYAFFKMVIMSQHYIPEHIATDKSGADNLLDYLNGSIKFFKVLPREFALAYMSLFLESFFTERKNMVEHMQNIGLPFEKIQMKYINFIRGCYDLGKEKGEWQHLTDDEFMALVINYIQGIKIMYFFTEMQFPIPLPELFIRTLENVCYKEER